MAKNTSYIIFVILKAILNNEMNVVCIIRTDSAAFETVTEKIYLTHSRQRLISTLYLLKGTVDTIRVYNLPANY